MEIRRALPEETGKLSRIAYESKTYWNYDESYMKAAKPYLTVILRQIKRELVFVVEKKGEVRGFYHFSDVGAEPELVGCL